MIPHIIKPNASYITGFHKNPSHPARTKKLESIVTVATYGHLGGKKIALAFYMDGKQTSITLDQSAASLLAQGLLDGLQHQLGSEYKA